MNEHADTLRLYEMFIGDFEKAAPWNTSSIKGCKRFLDKIWSMSEKLVPGEGVRPELEAVANRTIKKVGEDIDALKANTAIAQLMIYVNALSDQGGATKAEYELLLELLNPFAPHMTEELWQQLGHTEQLAYHAWPTYDEAKCVEQTIEIAVQVNGKVKARIKVPAAIENADAIARQGRARRSRSHRRQDHCQGDLRQGQAGQYRGQRLKFYKHSKAERRLCLFWWAAAAKFPEAVNTLFL